MTQHNGKSAIRVADLEIPKELYAYSFPSELQENLQVI